MKNILSIDLEDYFCDLPFSSWSNYTSRVVPTTEIILELLTKYKVSATFFTLGSIAEQFPELIEKIVSLGHEIASHGYSHLDLRKINKDILENEIKKSIILLEKISGEKINGFRAPFFSISRNNLDSFDIIQKYFKYDSSIFPAKTPLYGIPSAPRFPYRFSSNHPLEKNPNGKLLELPPATLKIPLYGNLPIAGGFYLRFLPLSLIKYGINKLNKIEESAMFYIHPKDLDVNMPKIDSYSWHYYYNLKNGKKKFESLLKNFKFSSVRDTYLF
ncbi:polysaccharide deacetylase family protein [Nitrosopumilus sp.]|jgi:peptidoglycan-N-acetylglucosamine deacetylase|nr:polysaccharide deacetylase family protein [Nitrosopumilus sp.]